jgi:hypothetical protein
MRYRIVAIIDVDARDDRQAYEHALKLDALLKSPMAKMMFDSEGIRLANTPPVVCRPDPA